LTKLHDDVEWKTRCDWAEWSAGHGVPYSVALDTHLQEPARLRCIHDLWFEYYRKVEPLLELRVQSLLEGGPQPIGSIIESLKYPKPYFDEILAIAARGKIYIETAQDFTLDTIIRFPDPANPPARLTPFYSPRLGDRP